MDREKYLEKLKESIDVLSDILDTENYGMCLVDKDGRIVKWNYERLFRRREEEVLGLAVEDVIENTRLHIVAKTGKKELFQIQKIHGNHVIANRIPIILDGETVGAAGTIIYKDTKELAEAWHYVERAENNMKAYKSELAKMYQAHYQFDNIQTINPKMEALKHLCQVVAGTQATVLLQGESGTGKELFAQAIHNASLVCQEPFVSINCASIPKDLLESELFGYESGAFTGARREGKIGKFELAGSGTLFLDELGAMPLEMQAKLLRVLENHEFERVGGNKKITLEARIIAATNERLSESVTRGTFRSDLYYRLSVVSVDIPPLRERLEDLPELCMSLLISQQKKYNMGNFPASLSPKVLTILKRHDWPGNVRELRNVMERAVIMSQGREILECHLPDYLQKLSRPEPFDCPKELNCPGDICKAQGAASEEMEQEPECGNESYYYRETRRLERQMIIKALRECRGNRTEAARRLGIHRSVIYKKMKDLRISVEEF